MEDLKHTSGPWKVGEFYEYGGYDCMTAGVRCGPAVLDGSDYGQKRCQPLADDAKARMLADARLIAAAPEMFEALQCCLKFIECEERKSGFEFGDAKVARAALAKARGEP